MGCGNTVSATGAGCDMTAGSLRVRKRMGFRNGMTARHARLYVLRRRNRDARAAVAFRRGISAPRTSLGVLRAGDGGVLPSMVFVRSVFLASFTSGPVLCRRLTGS